MAINLNKIIAIYEKFIIVKHVGIYFLSSVLPIE